MKRYLVLCVLLTLGCAARSPETVVSAPSLDTVAPSLAALCETHRTDKCAHHHNYVEIYGTFFSPERDRARRVLEIGVALGDSMRLWQDYFPNARIYGIDIADTSIYDTDRITTFVADQSSREQLGAFLEAHGSDFDIIIDDGGHAMDMQQISFGFLFPHLKPGGLYVIEDVHTSFPHVYPGFGVNEDESNTTFSMIVDFIRDSRFESEYLTRREEWYLTDHVEHCLYWVRANEFHSDMFVCKKKDDAPPASR